MHGKAIWKHYERAHRIFSNYSIIPCILRFWASFATLVSMATDSSNRVIFGENSVATFSRLLFILAGNSDIHKSLDEFEIRPGSTTDYGVSCP